MKPVTKYQTIGTSTKITPVEIIAENEKTIWTKKQTKHGELYREVASPKISEYYCYHDTYEAACEYLALKLENGIITTKRMIERLHGRIYKAEKRITELERMKEAGE